LQRRKLLLDQVPPNATHTMRSARNIVQRTQGTHARRTKRTQGTQRT